MPCHTVRADDGAITIVCMRGKPAPKCRWCGRTDDVKLCDYPVKRKGKETTCDAKCCARCALSVGDDLDYCPPHARHHAKGGTVTETKRKTLKPRPIDEIAGTLAGDLLAGALGLHGEIDAAKVTEAVETAKVHIDADRKAQVAWYRSIIGTLMGALGAEKGRCKYCQRPIWWLKTKKGVPAPWTLDGLNHWADCEKAPKK